MPKRIQSPSSIITFKQCPRKYFYQYIIKYPTKENIHCIRGNIVHDALEKFYSIDLDSVSEKEFKKEVSFFMRNLFEACWSGCAARLSKVGLIPEELSFYHKESMQMLANWLNYFFERLEKEMKQNNISLKEAFNRLKPVAMEKKYLDEERMVQGYIDAIHNEEDGVLVLDYKTSKSSELKPEYLLQLGIYALLYEKTHGVYPGRAALWFLKDKMVDVKVTPKLVKDALFEVEQIHFSTESSRITDYPKKQSPLCKWSTGECDFYEVCNKN